MTGYTGVITIAAEHEEDKIQWAFNKSIYKHVKEPETFKELIVKTKWTLVENISYFWSENVSVKKSLESDQEKQSKIQR